MSDDQRQHLARGRLAGILGVVAVACCMLGTVTPSALLFPAGLVLGVSALVLGILARRGVRRGGGRVPGARMGVVLGAVTVAFGVLVVVTAVVFWPQLREWQDCQAGANTHTSQTACREAFEERMYDRLGRQLP